jgi:hypothetical protein
MAVDRVRGYEQSLGDLPVGETVGHETRHTQFGVREGAHTEGWTVG